MKEELKVRVDHRESAAVFEALELVSAMFPEFTIERGQLTEGDVSFEDLLIEHKLGPDFAASIIDGRFKSQSERMLEHSSKIVFIVTGNIYEGVTIHKHAIIGKFTSLALKFKYRNVSVVFVPDEEGFAYACYSLAKKYREERLKYATPEHPAAN